MTPLGQKLRVHRAINCITLKDMALAIDISPSYLSSLEHGKKGKPSTQLLEKISTYLKLTSSDKKELMMAAHESSRNLLIPDNVSPDVYRIAHRFMQSINVLSSAQLEKIDDVIKDNVRNDYIDRNGVLSK